MLELSMSSITAEPGQAKGVSFLEGGASSNYQALQNSNSMSDLVVVSR